MLPLCGSYCIAHVGLPYGCFCPVHGCAYSNETVFGSVLRPLFLETPTSFYTTYVGLKGGIRFIS